MIVAAFYSTQMRFNPTVAIASLINNAYKRRAVLNAQDADVAQTTVGVTHLRSTTTKKAGTCPVYVYHRHACALQRKDVHVIVLSRPNAHVSGMRS